MSDAINILPEPRQETSPSMAGIISFKWWFSGTLWSKEKEPLARAVECVNACAGMANPAEEVRAMREALETIAMEGCHNDGACELYVDTRRPCAACTAINTLKGKA